jgi:hypothetical protein
MIILICKRSPDGQKTITSHTFTSETAYAKFIRKRFTKEYVRVPKRMQYSYYFINVTNMYVDKVYINGVMTYTVYKSNEESS